MNQYEQHIKDVCQILDDEIKNADFVNDKYDLLSQTVKHKIMYQMCFETMVKKWEGVLTEEQVGEMINNFIDNVFNVLKPTVNSVEVPEGEY
ncbi:hypothetical protein [Francisella philomiragia]|uniref:hypothetical protein n=1 Tax=Francisella philomiragia TaxID=28110 RepID=UPI00190339C8|nr:hypothetical protein [Francisella philomiragia]MBK2270211.1 hypothetical protein [Francisella philomiragia]MBK2275875.1 hypothetical protein [Francisella philomiragia]MBK2305088.1 hypothetical protein [Francisella philomiragia]